MDGISFHNTRKYVLFLPQFVGDRGGLELIP